MADKLVPLALPPGLANNGTVYQTQGRWCDGHLIRFTQNTIRPWGGWVARTLTGASIVGVPRSLFSWTPEVIGVAQRPILAVGTTSHLYVVVDNVVHDITPAAVIAATNNVNRIWQFEVYGSYLLANAYVEGDYTKTLGPYVWTGDTGAAATLITQAPISPTTIVATPERFLFILGGVDPLGPQYLNFGDTPSQRTVFWPSQESITDWTPTAQNSAGAFPLATDGALRCGRVTRGQTLLWTTTDLHTASYIGGDFLYRFDRVGEKCGVISSRAAVGTDTVAFWMGVQQFYSFDGYVRPLPCEVSDYVFNDLNRSYAHLIWALSLPKFNEITWFYPSGSATEIDRYVTYNYVEKHWSFGSMPRTAGVSMQLPGIVPVMADASGVIYDHETGTTRSGVAAPFLTSGPVELDGSGDTLFQVQRIVPDEKTLGDVEATFYASLFPTAAETTVGPFTLANPTSVRVTARQMRVRLDEVRGSDWRVGRIRLGVRPSSRR